ncbi:ras-related protein Rab-3 isoform X1 [Cloeon dipterum]|uniref:ras-related protein Rab-3 isoform X1 n=1 Tax=Cloeon dipterum TaxID=197152 RepID=UPI00321F73CD
MGDGEVDYRGKSNNPFDNGSGDYDFVIDREKRVTRMISINEFPPINPYKPVPALIEEPEPLPRPPARLGAPKEPQVDAPTVTARSPALRRKDKEPRPVPRNSVEEKEDQPSNKGKQDLQEGNFEKVKAKRPEQPLKTAEESRTRTDRMDLPRRPRNPKYTRTFPLPMAGQDPKWQKDAADQNFDYMFKLLIIGNSSVGKTSFLFRYADDSFTSAFVSTVGIDFKVKTVFRHDKRVKLQIWDTAGQERYRTITTAYYRGAMGFILMYDITNEESFNSVQDWVTQIKTYSWDNAQVILVGNKCDMEDERVISYERGKQLAEQLGIEFFETSAKENINVKAVFERLVDIICDKMSESLDTDPNLMNASKGTRLTETNQTGPQSPNCNC